jgi:hypothetical protein
MGHRCERLRHKSGCRKVRFMEFSQLPHNVQIGKQPKTGILSD